MVYHSYSDHFTFPKPLGPNETLIGLLASDWRRLNDAAEAAGPQASDWAMEVGYYINRDAIGDVILAQPPVTASDLASKIIIGTMNGQFDLGDSLWSEIRKLAGVQ